MNATLVAQTSELIDQYSAEQRELARRLEALRRARTELRLGRSPAVVLALLEEDIGERLETMIGEMGRGIPSVHVVPSSSRPPVMNGVLVSLALRR